MAVFSVGVLAARGAEPNAGFDALFGPLSDAKSPGLAVLIRKDGRTLYQRGFGVRDLRTLTPIDAQTNFRLASVTKQFTAMAAMLLVHDAKLRYSQTLADVLPGFPEYAKAITIRHLLTHTSGLPDYEDLMESAEKAKGVAWTSTRQIHDEEVLDLLKQQTRGRFEPGASWAYSNSGYVLLGLIVARVSGQPFPEFLRRRIFVPLHMDGTLVYVNGKNTVRHRAYGHQKRDDQFVESDQSSTSATLGDGGVYSNLNDLAKWDDALGTHRLLRQEEMNAALIPVTLANDAGPRWPAEPGGDNLHPGLPVSYGFGWFLDPYARRPRMYHTGTTMGFRTVIERYQRERLSIIVLCNRTDLDPANLALKAADIAFSTN